MALMGVSIELERLKRVNIRLSQSSNITVTFGGTPDVKRRYPDIRILTSEVGGEDIRFSKNWEKCLSCPEHKFGGRPRATSVIFRPDIRSRLRNSASGAIAEL